MPRCMALTQKRTPCRLNACCTDNMCHVHGASRKSNAIATCSVCLDDICEKDKHMMTLEATCGHTFHKPCLLSWFTKSNITCPNCRTEVAYADFYRTFVSLNRSISTFMTEIHYFMGRMKSICALHNREPIFYGVNTEDIVEQLALSEARLPQSYAIKKWETIRYLIKDAFGEHQI